MHNNLPFKSSFITMAGPRGQNPSMVLPSRNCPPFLNCQSLALTSCATVYPNTQSMALSTCNIQTTVYPNTQPMALPTCSIQTKSTQHTVHGFVKLQHSDHSVHKHSPWLCHNATLRPHCTQTQRPTCNIQTTVYPNTVHSFVNLQHSDHIVPRHKAQPASFKPQCTQTHSMSL